MSSDKKSPTEQLSDLRAAVKDFAIAWMRASRRIDAPAYLDRAAETLLSTWVADA